MMSRALGHQAMRACRQLLRHVNQPASQEMRSLLRALASDLRERDRMILLRCDLAGEPHKIVARDLGLSMRQFYRDRAAMIERLTMLLEEHGEGSNPALVTLDVGSLELARATAMQLSGQRDAALALLRSIAASEAHEDVRLAARCSALAIRVEENAFEDARAELDVLEAVAQTQALPDLARARIAHERCCLLWCSGHEREAMTLGEGAAASIAAIGRRGGHASREFAASALTMLARQALMYGHFEAARTRLEAAQDVLSLEAQAEVWTRINVLILRGALHMTRRTPYAAPTHVVEAARLAVRHGLTELAALAALVLSINEQMHGNAEGALSAVQQVLPAAKTVSRMNAAHLCLRLASASVAARCPHQALPLLNQARVFAPVRNYIWMYTDLLESRAYAALRDFASAQQAASAAASAARVQRNGRVEGNAMLALAESLIGRNAKSEAVDAVQGAIELLESASYPAELLRAYATAAKLTGRRRYTDSARELELLLTSA